MWGNEKERSSKSNSSASVDTLVGRQTELQGDIRFSGGLHIDGTVKGKIMADADKNATLSISESGKIEGDVRVPNLVLNGIIEGDVHVTQRITLSAHARVNGDVYYKILEMSSGAMVNGQLVHESSDQIQALTHDDAANASSLHGSNSSASDVSHTEAESV